MLVNSETNRHNRRASLLFAAVVFLVGCGLALASPWWLVVCLLSPLTFWWSRRRTNRRLFLMNQPFPESWERVLQSHVDFFVALDEAGKDRFRNLVKIFVDEVAITGIRTEVDDMTIALVAASAVIPVFGFDDWEYSGLGEVLIYPNAYGEDYRTDDGADRHTLGMVGAYHLSGVMILSKPDLITGFDNRTAKRNVGIHEFAHLVDKADGSIDGVASTTTSDVSELWIRWVAEELRRKTHGDEHIDDYAFTNEAEYFAVLSEYFFEAPEILEHKNPQLYQLLQNIYHQDPKRLLAGVTRRARRIGRNENCPCGSGTKRKRCCGK